MSQVPNGWNTTRTNRVIYIIWYQRTASTDWGLHSSYTSEEQANTVCEQLTKGCDCRTFGVVPLTLVEAVPTP